MDNVSMLLTLVAAVIFLGVVGFAVAFLIKEWLMPDGYPPNTEPIFELRPNEDDYKELNHLMEMNPGVAYEWDESWNRWIPEESSGEAASPTELDPVPVAEFANNVVVIPEKAIIGIPVSELYVREPEPVAEPVVVPAVHEEPVVEAVTADIKPEEPRKVGKLEGTAKPVKKVLASEPLVTVEVAAPEPEPATTKPETKAVRARKKRVVKKPTRKK